MRIQYMGLKFTLIVQDGWAMGTSHTLRNCILHSMSVRLIIIFEPLHVTERVMERYMLAMEGLSHNSHQ